MSNYEHGIQVVESSTALTVPVTGNAGLQVVVGTAPIHLTGDTTGKVNEPLLCNDYAEAVSNLGYSDDFEKYTLCQSMYASFQVFSIAPVIFINVLDPEKHKKENEEATYVVSNNQAIVNVEGILLDSLVVTYNSIELTKDVDYVASFNSNGYVVISIVEGGAATEAESLTVKSTSVDPEAVTYTDIIGGYDALTGKNSGIECVNNVYSKFSLTPGLLLAPGWSHIPEVAAALDSKSTVSSVYSCEHIVDIDTEKAKVYTAVKEVKDEAGVNGKHTIACWPMVKVGGKIMYYSALLGAAIAYTDAQNDDVPNLSPSNKLLGISAIVLKDGSEVYLQQAQANTLNSFGVVTALNDSGWRSWGNNMACYPENSDVKDRWINCRRFFSWWGNTFINTYKDKVDNPANKRLIETVIDSENIRGNSLVAQGKCAGARMEFNAEDNPTENLIAGKIKFKQYLAQYTPAESIKNELEFDVNMLTNAING